MRNIGQNTYGTQGPRFAFVKSFLYNIDRLSAKYIKYNKMYHNMKLFYSTPLIFNYDKFTNRITFIVKEIEIVKRAISVANHI